MSKKTLADIVFWFHMVWIGVLLSVIFLPPHLQFLHTIAASATIASQVLWGGCPLVTLENALRDDPYTGSFTAYLLHKTFGIEVESWAVATSLVGIFLVSVFMAL